jgi:hypothetical protein
MPIALIVGGAECVWEDVEAAKKLFTPDTVVAINDMGMYVEEAEHWASMHPEKMNKWVRFRRQRQKFPDPQFWTAEHKQIILVLVLIGLPAKVGVLVYWQCMFVRY